MFTVDIEKDSTSWETYNAKCEDQHRPPTYYLTVSPQLPEHSTAFTKADSDGHVIIFASRWALDLYIYSRKG